MQRKSVRRIAMSLTLSGILIATTLLIPAVAFADEEADKADETVPEEEIDEEEEHSEEDESNDALEDDPAADEEMTDTSVPIEPSFNDVREDHFAFEAIEYLTQLGLLEGKATGVFDPDVPVTRAEVAKVVSLNLRLKKPENYQTQAQGLSSNHWAYSYLSVMEYHDIIIGDDNGIRANDSISRAEMSTILNRSYNYAKVTTFTPFTDLPYRHWAYNHVNTLAINGITTQGNGSFYPENSLTRAEFAIFLARTLDDRFK